MTVLPIIFILGPSGVGKSKVSSLIEADLQFLHIDFDRPNGFKEFQEQWDSFRKKHNLGPLVSALRNRIAAAGRSGAVLSLPSNKVLTRKQIDVAKSEGICTIVLWGPEELCKKAARERSDGPVTNEKRYNRSNRKLFGTYSSSEYADLKIEAFHPDGSHLSGEDIMTIIRARLFS